MEVGGIKVYDYQFSQQSPLEDVKAGSGKEAKETAAKMGHRGNDQQTDAQGNGFMLVVLQPIEQFPGRFPQQLHLLLSRMFVATLAI